MFELYTLKPRRKFIVRTSYLLEPLKPIVLLMATFYRCKYITPRCYHMAVFISRNFMQEIRGRSMRTHVSHVTIILIAVKPAIIRILHKSETRV